MLTSDFAEMIIKVLLYTPNRSCFSRTPTCVRQTQTRTQGHGIYRASIASRGKKQQSIVMVNSTEAQAMHSGDSAACADERR